MAMQVDNGALQRPASHSAGDVRRPSMRYHGGKYGSGGSLADWIVSYLPEHQIYVEPFGGAASVLMRKSPARTEIYNDAWDEVVNVFRVLREPDKARRLAELLKLTPYARSELEHAREYPAPDDPVERARRTIVRAFMSYAPAGVDPHHDTSFRVSLRPDRSSAATEWSGYPEAIPAFTRRLRGVTIECEDALALMPRYDAPDALFYVDPPYLAQTRGTGRRSVYWHDYASEADHEALAHRLDALTGMVVLSGYDHPLYHECLENWTVISRSSRANVRHTGDRTELLWLNPAASAALGISCPEGGRRRGSGARMQREFKLEFKGD